jgi:hypothetical protein
MIFVAKICQTKTIAHAQVLRSFAEKAHNF